MATTEGEHHENAPVDDAGLETAADHTSRKRKASKPTTIISQLTLRKPEWAYVHLRLISPASIVARMSGSDAPPSIDEVTAYMHVQSALKSFLGFHGTAMALDFLKIDGQDIWIRSLRQDVNALIAAVGGWNGSSGEAMRVMTWGCWGPREGGNGVDLFND